MYQDQNIIQTLLYTIEQIATQERVMVDDAMESYVSSTKVLDIGREMVIPHSISNAASSKYMRTNTRPYRDISMLCDVLIGYLRERKNYPVMKTSRENEFKYPGTGTEYSLQFSDFFIVEQAYMIVNAYLERQDDYGYEYDGVINLSVKVALYLFERILKHPDYDYYSIAFNMQRNPGGFYYFPVDTNVMNDIIHAEIGRTEGIYEYTEDDEDDEDWEEDE